MKFTPCNLISCFIVYTVQGLFGHVGDFPWVPKYSLLRSILSMIRDKSDGQGTPGVRGFLQFHILLLHLSPQGVDLHNSARVWQSLDRSIRGKRGRRHGSSMSAVVGVGRRVE